MNGFSADEKTIEFVEQVFILFRNVFNTFPIKLFIESHI